MSNLAAVWSLGPEDSDSLKLAKRLGLPLCVSEDPPATYGWILFYEEDVLYLFSPQHPELHPFCVDYLSGDFAKRWHRFTREDILYKAIGHKKTPLKILDTTCGLGYDAFYLATIPGLEVRTCERNPLLAELVMDALLRVKEMGRFEEFPIYFSFDDALTVLEHLRIGEYDVIYLDPMYPREEDKSAKQKKELFLLRELVGSDQDAERLFQLAYAKAGKRVVVKRPDKAPLIASVPEPSLRMSGKTVRFDIYLKQ